MVLAIVIVLYAVPHFSNVLTMIIQVPNSEIFQHNITQFTSIFEIDFLELILVTKDIHHGGICSYYTHTLYVKWQLWMIKRLFNGLLVNIPKFILFFRLLKNKTSLILRVCFDCIY